MKKKAQAEIVGVDPSNDEYWMSCVNLVFKGKNIMISFPESDEKQKQNSLKLARKIVRLLNGNDSTQKFTNPLKQTGLVY